MKQQHSTQATIYRAFQALEQHPSASTSYYSCQFFCILTCLWIFSQFVSFNLLILSFVPSYLSFVSTFGEFLTPNLSFIPPHLQSFFYFSWVFFLNDPSAPLCTLCTFSIYSILGWANVPKVELEISTPLQIEVLDEISAWLKL